MNHEQVIDWDAGNYEATATGITVSAASVSTTDPRHLTIRAASPAVYVDAGSEHP
jgi:hypothetical protein